MRALGPLFLLLPYVVVAAEPTAGAVPTPPGAGPAVVTDASQLSVPVPPDFSIARFNGLMEKGAKNYMTTTWGSMPHFEGLQPLLEEPDGLPETPPLDHLILDGTPLEAVLRKLANQMRISYVSPSDINGTITADYHAISPTNIFRSLARMSQRQVARYYSAFTLEPLKASPPLFRRYKLDFNYEDKSDSTGSSSMLSSTSSGSSGVVNGSGGGSMGGGMNSSNATALKPDYSDFITNIKTLAAVSFGNREVAPPVVVYDEDEKVLTLHASAAGHAAVMTYLETVNRPQSNVALEIFVAETSLNPVTDLGIDWDFTGGYKVTFDRSNVPNDSLLGNIISANAPRDAQGNAVVGGGLPLDKLSLPNISATVRALQSDTKSRTYAHPRVLTTNNKPVTLESVTEIPYMSSSMSTNVATNGVSSGLTNATAFKRVGISVGMWPITQGQGLVRMKTSVHISSLQGFSPLDNQPIVSERSYGGNFTVEDGEYIVIGGLGQSAFTNTKAAVPMLANMPFLGALFRNEKETKDTKHLLIFIRPIVLDRYNRGLALDTMGKAAMFTSIKEGRPNFTVDGVFARASEAPDPFVRAQLDKTIVELEHKRQTNAQTLEILRNERDTAVAQREKTIGQSRERMAQISLEMKEEKDPETLRRLAAASAAEKAREETMQADLEASRRSYERAMAPLEKAMDQINRDLKVQQEALRKLLEAERTTPALPPPAAVVAPAVRVDVGGQVAMDASTPKVLATKVEAPDVVTKEPAKDAKKPLPVTVPDPVDQTKDSSLGAETAAEEAPTASRPPSNPPKVLGGVRGQTILLERSPPKQDVIESLFQGIDDNKK